MGPLSVITLRAGPSTSNFLVVLSMPAVYCQAKECLMRKLEHYSGSKLLSHQLFLLIRDFMFSRKMFNDDRKALIIEVQCSLGKKDLHMKVSLFDNLTYFLQYFAVKLRLSLSKKDHMCCWLNAEKMAVSNN